MAKNNLTMGYYLQKVVNPASRVNNRWFAYVDHMGNLTARAQRNRSYCAYGKPPRKSLGDK